MSSDMFRASTVAVRGRTPPTDGATGAEADPFDALRASECFRRLAVELTGRSVLVTGGTGFVGKWLLEARRAFASVATPPRMTVLARRPERLAAEHPRLAAEVDILAGDVRSLRPGDLRFDYIVHAANDTGPSVTADPGTAVSVIVEGTQRVFDLARRHPPRALLLLSSGAVYASRPVGGGALAEEDDALAPPPTLPGAAYGNAKRLCETLAAVAGERDRLPVKIARLFSFAGEHLPLDDQRAFGNLVRDAVAGEAVTLQGDGSAVRSYLYGADLALWLLAVLTVGAPLRPYNVGSDQAITLRQLATRVAARLSPGGALPVRCGSVGVATSSSYVPAIGRTRRELGVEVWTDLDTCIRRTGEYARHLQSKASSCGGGS